MCKKIQSGLSFQHIKLLYKAINFLIKFYGFIVYFLDVFGKWPWNEIKCRGGWTAAPSCQKERLRWCGHMIRIPPGNIQVGGALHVEPELAGGIMSLI